MAEGFLGEMRRRKEALVAARMEKTPLAELRDRARAAPVPRPFPTALLARRPAVIAEVKRSSPSAGVIRRADASATARAYERGGAAAVSVLTEESAFGGSLEDLVAVRAAVVVPVLRKDFLVHPWEVWEARAAGADAVLLIVALLGGDLPGMLAEAAAAGLEALVEAHDKAELEAALTAGSRLVGINNRNLSTLQVDIGTALRLAPLVPPGVTVVAESGYRTAADLRRTMDSGISAFLVGESLMRTDDPAGALRRLIGASRSSLDGRGEEEGSHE